MTPEVTDGDPACADDLDRRWRVLTELVWDAAEGFAATDPADAFHFRRDADRFCDRTPPRDDEDVADRYADASDLREAWAGLFVSRLHRTPR